MNVDIIGYIGLTLVFISFLIRRWTWLYTFNSMGAAILTLYAYLIGNIVFTILEAGITVYLLTRILKLVLKREDFKCQCRDDLKSLSSG